MNCIDCDHNEEIREDWRRFCNQSYESGYQKAIDDVIHDSIIQKGD